MAFPGQLDFDQLAALAENDPQSFEALRQQAIDALIDQAPARRRHRLRCLQWRIDRARERAANPLSACIALSGMMWQSLQRLDQTYQGRQDSPGRRAERARIVPLRPRS